MYFSNPLGITSIFTSNVLSSWKIKWLSWPLKLWNITGRFLVNWRFLLQLHFSSYMKMISNFFIVIINEFFTNPTSITWSTLFFSSVMIKFLLKCFLLRFHSIHTPLWIASINLKAAFSPLKATIGLLNLSSTQKSL